MSEKRESREREDEAAYYVEETQTDEHETLTKDDVDHGVYNERKAQDEESWSGSFILRKGKKTNKITNSIKN